MYLFMAKTKRIKIYNFANTTQGLCSTWCSREIIYNLAYFDTRAYKHFTLGKHKMVGNEKSTFWILVYIHKIFHEVEHKSWNWKKNVCNTKSFDGKFAKWKIFTHFGCNMANRVIPQWRFCKMKSCKHNTWS